MLDRREVVLEGRAFFAVATDPVPFVVRTRLGQMTVRGTRFEASLHYGTDDVAAKALKRLRKLYPKPPADRIPSRTWPLGIAEDTRCQLAANRTLSLMSFRQERSVVRVEVDALALSTVDWCRALFHARWGK